MHSIQRRHKSPKRANNGMLRKLVARNRVVVQLDKERRSGSAIRKIRQLEGRRRGSLARDNGKR